MNWVGGSRNRIIFKQERRKQKEFFEKKKLKSKLKLLESTSPKKPTISLDLQNLNVVNQISMKKETDKKPQHIDMCKEIFSSGRNNAELPMSPITTPSKLCLDDSEILSLQVTNEENKKNSKISTYPPDQKINSTEMEDMTADDNNRKGYLTDYGQMKNGSEMIPGIQQYLHSSGTNDKDADVLAKEEFQAKPLSLLTEKGTFYYRDKCDQVNSGVSNTGKCDQVSQCFVAKECKFF
ncbi:regulator of DNA class I crossover intermediates 1 [Mantella aurantiaca]